MEGRGAGGGWGIPKHPRPGLGGPGAAPGGPRLATTCPDQAGFILHPGRRSRPAASRWAGPLPLRPACIGSAPGIWVLSVAPVRLQRPASGQERAAKVSRGLGCSRRTWEPAADGASRCPRSPALLPLPPAVSRDAADPASLAAAAPCPGAFTEAAPKPRYRPRPPAFVFAGSGAGPAVRQAGCPARGWRAEGTGKRAPFFPVPAILRPRFHQGAQEASRAVLGAGVAVAGNRDGCLWPRAPPPRTAVGARGHSPTFSAKGLGPRSCVNPRNRQEAQTIRGLRADIYFKRLIH